MQNFTVDVQILTGIHAGVSVPLEMPICRIGSNIECDIILRDENIAPEHLVIRTSAGRIYAEALGADINVGDTKVKKGTGFCCVMPVSITLGHVQIRIVTHSDNRAVGITKKLNADGFSQQALQKFPNRSLMFMGIGSLCVLSALYPFMAASKGEQAPVSIYSQAEDLRHSDRKEHINLPAHTNTHLTGVLEQTSVVSAAPALREKISAAALNLQVVEETPFVRVSGSLAAEARGQWVAVQQWFDMHYGNSHILESAVSVEKPLTPPRLKLQAVWFGKDPYVINEHGERLYPGAALSDGWVLRRIEPKQLVLGRDEQEFLLTL